jgi:hypothetical protein
VGVTFYYNKIMSKLNLNPADTLQNALPETYTEKELLNCLELIWKNRIFVEQSDMNVLTNIAKSGTNGI